MPLTRDAANRAAVAVARVIANGESFTAAARGVGTTVRTMKLFLQENRIGMERTSAGRWEIVRTAAQKVPEFLEGIWSGESATAVARRLATTVRTMGNQMLPDESGTMRPVIVKIGNTWTPNFVGVREYSMTLHGSLIGLNDSVQGRGEQAGPDAQQADADPEYADIWWQVDFNSFPSTLAIGEVGPFYQASIVEALRAYLEAPDFVNTGLANRFLGNASVASAAGVAGRLAADGSMMLSRLEQFLERYDIRMAPDVTVGVEPASGLVSPVNWVWLGDFGTASERAASGQWQVMFLTSSERQEYPITVSYEYDLLDEID